MHVPLEAGKYIVLEGGDNVGKTTQVKVLADSLGAIQTREPGGTEAGEAIRNLLLDPGIEKTPEAAVLLHAAQRAELISSLTELFGLLLRTVDMSCLIAVGYRAPHIKVRKA